MEKTYDHKASEERIYKMWEDGGYFNPDKTNPQGKPFCVLMPPPNANAALHCGHVTYAIQDLMARYYRMKGYKTLYLPGTDHAGFETQVVYERKLKKEGKTRFDFDRQTLYNAVFEFVKQNSDLAIGQLKRIGMSADWTRNTFMLDERVVDTVYDTFIKMHNDGLIYRDVYMVNYSPHHGTTFSNLETTHKETVSPLYYVRYAFKDGDGCVTAATVRPETIYGDVAIAVNSTDSRYDNLVGRVVLNPLNGRELPIIADNYVDIDFGTGALKITPGHDFSDYEIGRRHKLPIVTVIGMDGKMTEAAGALTGLKVVVAREKTVEILKQKGALEKIDEHYTHNLLVDYKDGLPIEPLPLPNWFIKVASLSKKAIEEIERGKIKFNKPTWKKQTLDWLANMRDWPISRQTVFGIRIPAWYKASENPDLFVVFLDDNGISHDGKLGEFLSDKSLTLAQIKKGLQKTIASVDARYVISKETLGEDFIQETDTFDTWFSSGQWPETTLGYPDGADFKTFYPTSFMDSMWDILFFWIVRMVIFGLYLTGEVPFKTVYIHGRVDDALGRKMSKSFGNVIDPLDFIDKYGADALRMGILVGGNTAAKTTPLSEDKVRGYRNFANKIWNMGRFIEYTAAQVNLSEAGPAAEEDEEVLRGAADIVKRVEALMQKMKFKDAGEAVYHFMWNELADKYIERVKTREDKATALVALTDAYFICLKLLHPFMPFVTEEIWQQMKHLHKQETALIVSKWPAI